MSSDYEIETFSGNFVDVANPDPSKIKLRDIAHALSQTCRYGGHCRSYLSVAEHSVFVSKRLERKGHSFKLQLAGLHHDDAEAFLGDIPRPMKPLLGYGYEALSDLMNSAIIEALELPLTDRAFHDEVIKDADNWSLFVEARYLLPSKGQGWWDGEQGSYRWEIGDQPSRIVTPDYWHGGLLPPDAKELFLTRHDELMKGLK